MKKVPKVNKNKQKDNNLKNRVLPKEDYGSNYLRVRTKNWFTVFARTLLEWVKNTPDAFVIDEFYHEYCLYHVDVQRYIKESQEVADAVNEALRILGTRRHKTAFKKQTSEKIMLHTQHLYTKEWHQEVNLYHAEVNKKEENGDVIIQVITTEDPTSDVVPELSKE